MIYKIVLTGGPCAGKTTGIQRIVSEFSEKGYKVVVVPEAATLLINSGIKPFGKNSVDLYDFQKCVLDVQKNLERITYDSLDPDVETIMLCDRGIIDCKAFVDEKDFAELLGEFDLNELDVSASYDMVIHLRSCALGKEEFYTLENNSARTETVEEARVLDQRTLESWAGHGKLRVIGNDGSFEDKINKVCDEIYGLIKKSRPVQIQKKFLVDYIDIEKMSNLDYSKFDIEQYVVSDGSWEKIYRKTSHDGDDSFSIISKLDTDINSERIVTQRRIDEDEYYENLSGCVIKKTRYTFEYDNQYFKLDVFDDMSILEVDLTDKNKEFEIPDFVSVKEDVTEDKEYRNSSIYDNKVLRLV